jgi:hypothetical protein
MAVAPAAMPELTIVQLEEMLRAKREQAKQNGPKIREELEDYCLKKYGMSLASIVSSTRKAPTPKTFVNPQTNEEYTYPGKGAYPDWLKRDEAKKAYAKK